MFNPLLAQLTMTWYLLPLAIVVSLVYSASRYELPERIIRRTISLFLTIIGCMFLVFIVLWLLSYGL